MYGKSYKGKKVRFHGIADVVLGSRAKIQIFKTLTRFPEKKFSGREISRLVGVSPSQTLEILNTFQESGIVNRIRIGNLIEWSLNKESFMAKSLSNLADIDKRAQEHLKGLILKRVRPHRAILKVSLFGSIAEAKEKPSSDIDLFILVLREKDKKTAEALVNQLNMEAVPVFGNMISAIVYSKDELRRKKNMELVEKISKNGIPILDRDVRA